MSSKSRAGELGHKVAEYALAYGFIGAGVVVSREIREIVLENTRDGMKNAGTRLREQASRRIDPRLAQVAKNVGGRKGDK